MREQQLNKGKQKEKSEKERKSNIFVLKAVRVLKMLNLF